MLALIARQSQKSDPSQATPAKPASMETGLRLLMRDGALQIRFQPRLTAPQYAELALLIDRPSTKEELCNELEAFAQRWGIQVMCDDVV
jgi:hypothetical protein